MTERRQREGRQATTAINLAKVLQQPMLPPMGERRSREQPFVALSIINEFITYSIRFGMKSQRAILDECMLYYQLSKTLSLHVPDSEIRVLDEPAESSLPRRPLGPAAGNRRAELAVDAQSEEIVRRSGRGDPLDCLCNRMRISRERHHLDVDRVLLLPAILQGVVPRTTLIRRDAAVLESDQQERRRRNLVRMPHRRDLVEPLELLRSDERRRSIEGVGDTGFFVAPVGDVGHRGVGDQVRDGVAHNDCAELVRPPRCEVTGRPAAMRSTHQELALPLLARQTQIGEVAGGRERRFDFGGSKLRRQVLDRALPEPGRAWIVDIDEAVALK